MQSNRYGGVLCVAILAAFGLYAAPNCSVEMTTSGYTGTEELANFPLLVKFAKGQPAGFDYSQFRKAGAADLAFADAEGNPLAFEIDTWNPDGTSFVWVRIPKLTRTTKIVATWGDADASGASAGQVWAEAGYAGVWHMNETESQGTASYDAIDATGNGLTATPLISSTAGDAMMMVSRSDGAVGLARVNGAWETGQKGGNCLEVKGYPDSVAAAVAQKSEIAVSGWFNATVYNPNARLFGQKKAFNNDSGFEVQQSGNARTKGGTESLPASLNKLPLNQWHHCAFVVRGTEKSSSFYCDGVQMETGVLPEIVANKLSFTIGNNCNCNEVAYSGSYDEVRLLPAAVSSDWIKAEYETVANSAEFCKAGPVVDVTKFNTFTAEGSLSSSLGDVSPAYGDAITLQDGETVDFSAPDAEFPFTDDSYLGFAGYELYVAQPGEPEQLVERSEELTGSYRHVEGQIVRLVWLQYVRGKGEWFEPRHSSNVSVPGYVADKSLRNAVVLFRISENKPEGFSYSDCQANGADVLFTDAQGHVIPHDIEKWDATGESLIWVCLPRMRKETSFRFCYGNETVVSRCNNPCEVWTEAGYAGVWHMNETENQGTASYDAIDATGNGLTATPLISSTAGDARMMVSRSDGAVGLARVNGEWTSGQKYGNCLDVSGYPGSTFAAAVSQKSEIAVSGWFYPTVNNPNARLFGQKRSFQEELGFEVQQSGSARTKGSNPSLSVNLGSSQLNKWHHYAFVVRGTNTVSSFYCDGVEMATGVLPEIVANKFSFRIGNNCNCNEVAYSGSYDEVRLLPAAVSSDWIKAEYETVANPDFLYAAKVVDQLEPDVFIVESGDADGVRRGSVTPTWGAMENLEDGQVVSFSAPAGGQSTGTSTNFCFVGYELYVVENGVEGLAQKEAATSGSYTHAKGGAARLLWFTMDMPKVDVQVGAGGTVEGADFYMLGSRVTLRAVPADGMRFKGWSGEIPEGVKPTDAVISFVVDRAYRLVAEFEEKPVCAAFFSWKGHAEGEAVTVGSAANDLGTETFAASSVTMRNTGGSLPTFSKYHPGKVIYSDETREEVVTTDPGSIYFTSTSEAARPGAAGGDVIYNTIGTWISRQKSCTLEFFVRSERFRPYAGAWSMILSGEEQVFFASDLNPDELSLSVEASKSGTTGRARPGSGNTCKVNEAWEHVAVIYDRDNQKVTVHRNYGKGGEKSLVITETTDDVPFCLGSPHLRVDSNFFDGWISCLRLTPGVLSPEQFMRAELGDDAGDTLAVWDFRGKADTAVARLVPVVGDRDFFVGMPYDAAFAPSYSDDVPGEALYANAEDMLAGVPISKRVGSIELTCGEKEDQLIFPSLSTALSGCEDYTIECFVKCRGTDLWAQLLSWNDTSSGANNNANVLSVPGSDARSIRLQCGANSDARSNYGDLSPTGSNLADETWHHLAVTYEHATDAYTLIFDYGKTTKAMAGGKRAYTAAPLWVSKFIDDAHRKERFGGMISCLRVSRRALAPAEFMVAGEKPKSGLMLLVR